MASFPVVDGSDVPTPTPTPTPSPEPTPKPTPTPTPSPSGSDCVFADTEAECYGNEVDGKRCTWCEFEQIDVGLCLDPDYQCSTGPVVPSKRNHWLILAVSVAVVAMFVA